MDFKKVWDESLITSPTHHHTDQPIYLTDSFKQLLSFTNTFDKLAEATSFITTKAGEAVILRDSNEIVPVKAVTVVTLFERACETFPDSPALLYKTTPDSEWLKITFKEYYNLVIVAAKAFTKCGLDESNGVGLLGFNSPEWFISYFATIFAGGLATGIYTTNCPEACFYVLNNAKCNVAVVENDLQLQKILKVWPRLPHLRTIIQYKGALQDKLDNVYSWDEFLQLGRDMGDNGDGLSTLVARWDRIAPNKCCTLIYTSGTTGDSKGVMLSHDNVIWTATICGLHAQLERCGDVLVSYLPLSHVAAQILDMFIPLVYGVTVYFAQPDALKGTLGDTLKQVQPTVFLGVPRVWEKMQEKMMAAGKVQGWLTRTLVQCAKYIGYHGNISLMHGGTVPYGWTLANILVFSKVRKALGLERCKFCMSAAAPIMRETLDFFMSLNLPILQIYGMSETTGPHTVSFPWRYRSTSAGVELFGARTRLCPDTDEICMNGRNVFMGYLDMEEKTAESFDQEEWLTSGDIGVKDDGFLYITGRIKELIITAGGENVAPVPIEDCLKEQLNCISNCMLVGDKRKFLSILITIKTLPDPNTMVPTDLLHPQTLDWCKSLKVNASTLTQLLENPHSSVIKSIQHAIDQCNKRAVSRAQNVQKWSILPRDFSMHNGELGPTLKLRRMVVTDMYKATIDAFYEE